MDIYEKAKINLNRTPKIFYGRVQDAKSIKRIIRGSIEKKVGAALYIGGVTGTGKTAVLSHALKELELGDKNVLWINCMSNQRNIKSSITNWITLHHKLFSTLPTVVHHLRRIVLVLDEIDRADKEIETIYSLFEMTINTRIIVIGIANSLHYVHKKLPRLINKNIAIHHLAFHSYTSKDLHKIFRKKLKGDRTFIATNVIEFCSRKVAHISGDIRQAFHLFSLCIDLCRKEKTTKMSFRHVADVFNGQSMIQTQSPNKLSIHQQTVLVAMKVAIHQAGQFDGVNSLKIYSAYYNMMQTSSLFTPLHHTEILDILMYLESQALIYKSKSSSKNKLPAYRLNITWKELRSIQQVPFLDRVLQR